MFQKSSLPFSQTNAFNKIVSDYVEGKLSSDFYAHAYSLDAFQSVIEQKKFSKEQRSVLADVLQKQYGTLWQDENAKNVLQNISLLKNENTFTVTTGHQLNLLTGPLYFVYKILTTIKLAEELNKKYPAQNFVPVYWMATEDHDFEEIKSVWLFGKKVEWSETHAIATGKIKTQTIQSFVDEVTGMMGSGSEASQTLIQLVKQSYLEHETLADATRFLVHHLFAKYGLVILDADDASLKKQFVPIIKDEVLNETAFKIVGETNKQLEKDYTVQVNPREINFFYLGENYRERIVRDGENFKVNNQNKIFSKADIVSEIENHPEKFSPNVLLRPLYQESILPNLAYIGGPAEVHYWMQLKNIFLHHQLNFPVIVMRNCFLVIEEAQGKRLQKTGLLPASLFEPIDALITQFVKAHTSQNISVAEEESKISLLFEQLALKVSAVDITLKGTVEAEKQKAINALKNIESKLLKAEKQKNEVVINQLKKVKEKLFPNNALQERTENIFQYLAPHGFEFIDMLYQNCDTLPINFSVLEEKTLTP